MILLRISHKTDYYNLGYVTWSGTGLTFNVTGAIYAINGITYNSTAGSVTLATADPTNPRIDVIAVDTLGAIVTITGTASTNPSEPQIDPSSQVLLTSILVPAGATIPNILQTIIYDENTENFTGTTTGVTLNLDNTVNPYHLTKSANVGNSTGTKNIIFTQNTGTSNASDYSILKVYFWLKQKFASNANIGISFLNGTTVVSNTITLNASIGFTKTIDSSYQNVSIPMSSFHFTNNVFNKVRITLSGPQSGVYFDYMQLQGGINIPSNDPFVVNYSKNTTRDSTVLLLSNGQRFAAKDSVGSGGGGSGIDSLLKSNKNVVSARKSSVFVPQYIMGDTSILYAKDFGIIGDSSNGNYAAITAAISALPARGGKIIFGAGVFRVDTAVVVNKAVIFEGVGSGVFRQDQITSLSATKFSSISAVANLFNVTHEGVVFKNLEVANAATTPTAGAGIHIDMQGAFIIDQCYIKNFYNNINIVNGQHYSILNSTIAAAVNYGIRIRDSVITDGGDALIDGCFFYNAPNAARQTFCYIRQESGGGLKVTNCKFNNAPTYGYWGNFTGSTSVLIFTGNSFENIYGNSIRLTGNSIFNGSIVISGNEFSNFAPAAVCDIYMTGVTILPTNITGNTFDANHSGDTAIYASFIGGLAVNNSYVNYTTPTILSNSTNTITDKSTTTTQYALMASASATNGQLTQVSGLGTAGQLLASAGTGALPTWTNTLSGSYTFSSNAPIVNAVNNSTGLNASFGTLGIQSFAVNNAWIGENTYFNGSNFVYKANGSAGLFYFAGTEGQFRFAASGTAGATATALATTALLKINADGSFATGASLINAVGTYTNAQFYVKGSSGNVMINSITDNGSKLQVNGSLSVAYVAKTGNYTATASDHTIDCTSGTFTVTLPTAVGITGRIYTVSNSGAGTITIGTTSSQTFTNVVATPTTLTLAALGFYTVQSTGANWIVTAH